jgi:hypothetical protein
MYESVKTEAPVEEDHYQQFMSFVEIVLKDFANTK